MRTLAVVAGFVALAALATPAAADDTFEAKAAGAQRIGHVENLVWALTTSCDAGDDTQQRQCRRVRDSRVAELAGATLLVEADRDALRVGAWNAQKKSVPIELAACVRCAGVEVGGTTYRVVAGKDAALYDNARPFGDEAAAKAFVQSLANARVQLLVTVPANPKTVVGGKPAISLALVGYRVYAPCDGSVVVASPASGPVAPDKKSCAAK